MLQLLNGILTAGRIDLDQKSPMVRVFEKDEHGPKRWLVEVYGLKFVTHQEQVAVDVLQHGAVITIQDGVMYLCGANRKKEA